MRTSVNRALAREVLKAKEAAREVLLHNVEGPYEGLPRTAGWGYPEPYTRDLMISALGILASGDSALRAALRRVLERSAQSQTGRGHIPSLVHDPLDRGASDTTPLFLLAVAVFRRETGEEGFLAGAVERALTWMAYQSPGDDGLVAQLPTSDWRDEQWVLGFGLYVNAIVYAYLRLYGMEGEAARLADLANLPVTQGEAQERHVHEGLSAWGAPHYALWSYKIYSSDRFDLLGNSLAVIADLADKPRSREIVQWIERECDGMRDRGDLAVDLPPCFFPYIQPGDADWRPRYEKYNRPGEYHNGGIWPFASAFYVVATLAAGFPQVAERRLAALTELNRLAANPDLVEGATRKDHRGAAGWGFNEWIKAQNGAPRGQDWQTWSAAMYLYAAECVERGRVLFFSQPS